MQRAAAGQPRHSRGALFSPRLPFTPEATALISPLWIAFGTTLAASLLLTPLARLAARRFGVVDCPDGKRKLQKKPTPLLGGVAVYLALLAGLAAVHLGATGTPDGLKSLAKTVLAAAGFVCLLGIIDDARELRPRFKLLLQTVSILPVIIAGYYIDRVVVFGQPIDLGWLGIPLTLFWLLGCINAINLLDGMDGLASLVGISTAAIMAVIATMMGHDHVALICIGLAGALAGFLVYNLPPASIYLGDSGSMVIGLVVGILGMQGSLKTTATLSLTAPVVVLAIPMLDTVLAILRRRLSGRPIDAPDRGHIHHRLLDRGLSTWQALCIIGALVLTTGAAATAATILKNEALAWITVVCLFVATVRFRAFGHHEVLLIKRRVLSMFARLMYPFAPRSFPGRGKIVPARMTFDDAWSLLTEEASVAPIRRMELRIGREGREIGLHQWSAAGEGPTAGPQVALSLRFGEHDDAWCELRVEGRDATVSQTWRMLRLVHLFRRFGRHWAAHPDVVPAVLPMSSTTFPQKAA
jgi:UDP-GlcNAc:undecaprenyl-phosphate GlcNAc-1-phosphate transferase